MDQESDQTREQAPGYPVSRYLEHPDLLKIFDYWRGKRAGRPMPSRRDIDPLELGWALSRIALLDYQPGAAAGAGFRYRLAGEAIAAVFGRANLKGLTFNEIMPSKGARFVEERWMPMVERHAIVCMKGMIYLASERTPVGERLLLPLADEAGGPVTGVLVMTVCEWLSGDVPQEVKSAQINYIPVAEIV